MQPYIFRENLSNEYVKLYIRIFEYCSDHYHIRIFEFHSYSLGALPKIAEYLAEKKFAGTLYSTDVSERHTNSSGI